MRRKPISTRELRRRIKLAETLADIRQQKIEVLLVENAQLKRQLEARLDTSMIRERQELATKVGRMFEACADMIHVVIGKEVM
jgi:uncharacterized protein with von Willebrand factor type A (vWA) domain